MKRFLVAGLAGLLSLSAAASSSITPPPFAYTPGNLVSPTARSMLQFRNALAQLKTRNMVWDAVGQSDFAGQGCGTGTNGGVGAKACSVVAADVAQLNALGIPASNESFTFNPPPSTTVQQYDPRIGAYAAGWSTSGFVTAFGDLVVSTTNGTSLNLSPAAPFNTIDVLYISNSATGSVTVDGGTSLGTIPSGAFAVGKLTVSTTLGTHVINLNQTSAGALDILMVRPYDTTNPKLEVVNSGVPGSQSVTWATTTNQWSNGNATFWNTFAPDFVSVQIGSSDANAAVSPATFTSNMQTFLTNVLAASSKPTVLIASNYPFNSANVVNLPGITAAQQALATANGLPYLDVFTRYNPGTNILNAWALVNAVMPFYDALHMTAVGYSDEASVYTNFIQNVFGSVRSSATSVQTFTTSGTWTKPYGAKAIRIVLLGGGGGGGSGAVVAAATGCSGGGGGGGAGRYDKYFNAADLPSSLTITIGAGGTPGAASAGVGNAGGNGGTTSANTYKAFGGGGGGPGTSGTTSGGGGGSGINTGGGVGTTAGGAGTGLGNAGGTGVTSQIAGYVTAGSGGGGSSAVGVAGSGAIATDGGEGGGAGGGLTAANGTNNGFAGTSMDSSLPGVAAGVAPGGNGGNGANSYTPSGSSGAGGASATIANGGMGGNGGYGSGGGGGGSTQTGFSSGAGGTGGPGFAMIITTF